VDLQREEKEAVRVVPATTLAMMAVTAATTVVVILVAIASIPSSHNIAIGNTLSGIYCQRGLPMRRLAMTTMVEAAGTVLITGRGKMPRRVETDERSDCWI